MNSVKNKTKAVSKKKKLIAKGVSLDSNHTAVKKASGAIQNKTQYASTNEFFALKNISGYNIEHLAILLGITHRTIQNKKNSGGLFDIAQTERLRKLNLLFNEGIELFGNKEEFNKWLEKPAYGLDYTIPSELLKQPGGLDRAITELNSIKYGETV